MDFVSRLSFALAAVLMVLPGHVAADTSVGPTPMFGYLDPRTHVFTPAPTSVLVKPVPAAPAATPNATAPAVAATIVRAGTMTITATIKLVSPIPSNATFYTGMTIAVSDPATAPPPSYSSSANAYNPTVTRSGTVVTVKAVIPYRFVYTVAADTMTVNFYISYQGGTSPRFSTTQPMAVPANGAKTNFALAASL